MRFKKTFYIFLISIILLNLSLIYYTNINRDNDKFFRVHVVANSDSIDDQLLKYTIAKNVDQYITSITKNCPTKDESKQSIEQNIENILSLCNQTIKENNSDYTIKAYIGKMAYDKKSMNDFHMNAGTYDSLKIVIGNGNGANWWSLIYPTSFSDISNQDFKSPDTIFSLKILELIQNIFTEIK